MDCCCVKQMVVNLVVISDRSNNVCADMFLVIEGLQFAPDSAVTFFDELRFRSTFIAHLVGQRHVTIVPLLHFNNASPVVDFVGDVGSLCADVSNLTDECDLRVLVYYQDFGAIVWAPDMADSYFVNLMTGFGIWLFRVEDLFNGEGSHCVFTIIALVVIAKTSAPCYLDKKLSIQPFRQRDCL
jgi:hypothetical protein